MSKTQVLPLGHVRQDLPGPSLTSPSVVAGNEVYTHGMHWNGGDKYNVVGHIGKGAFADVFKLSTKQDGELFAVKEIETRRFMKDGILNHKAHNEINVMKTLNHVSLITNPLQKRENPD